MDLFQLGRRQHGRQSFITLDLVLEAELFQKPDDSLGSGTAQVVNGDHDTTLLGNRMQRPLPRLTSIEILLVSYRQWFCEAVQLCVSARLVATDHQQRAWLS